MTAPARINELNEAETPARELLEKLGYTYIPRQQLAKERIDERDATFEGRVRAPVKIEVPA